MHTGHPDRCVRPKLRTTSCAQAWPCPIPGPGKDTFGSEHLNGLEHNIPPHVSTDAPVCPASVRTCSSVPRLWPAVLPGMRRCEMRQGHYPQMGIGWRQLRSGLEACQAAQGHAGQAEGCGPPVAAVQQWRTRPSSPWQHLDLVC